MRWIAKENEDSPCVGLSIEDIPEKIPANIHFKHKQGSFFITSENVAGVLPCKHGHEIIIEPKYKNINPLELLMYTNNISGAVVNRERIQEGKSQIDLHTIADSFVKQLLSIKGANRKFKRTANRIYSDAVVGKVDWVKSYRNQIAGKTAFIDTKVRFASYDIPENALIAAAAKKIISLYPVESEEYSVLRPWYAEAESASHTYEELYTFHSRVNEKTLSGPHAFYYGPVMLAKIILGFNEADLISEEIDSILFNMPGLYEEYIRTGFQRAGGGFGYSIQKGLTPRSFLFYSGDCELIPDITIYEGTSIRALLDVKYKIPDSKDYYQLFAYMKYAGLDTAYIISPAVEHNQIVTAFDGSKVWHVKVDNSDPVFLEDAADKLIRGIP